MLTCFEVYCLNIQFQIFFTPLKQGVFAKVVELFRKKFAKTLFLSMVYNHVHEILMLNVTT